MFTMLIARSRRFLLLREQNQGCPYKKLLNIKTGRVFPMTGKMRSVDFQRLEKIAGGQRRNCL
jgi:hypothetical protein